MIFYSNSIQLLIIWIQIACYVNSYIMNILIFKPSNILITLILNLIYLRSLMSLYLANTTHKQCNQISQQKNKNNSKNDKLEQKNSSLTQLKKQSSQNNQSNTVSVQFCKHCTAFIQNRDHHCIYIGRCVQKENYQYFLSYVFFSYILSILGLFRLYLNYDFVTLCWKTNLTLFIAHFGFSLVSHIFFAIFTGFLSAGSIRSIIQGVYVVDQIKKRKAFKRTNQQFFFMCVTFKGIKQIYKQFKQNWRNMVGQNISFGSIFCSLS